MKINDIFRSASINSTRLWIGLFALLPFLLVLAVSLLSSSEHALIQMPLTLKNYAELFNPTYLHIFWDSFVTAAATTLGCLLLGYPFAYLIARTHKKYKSFLLLLVIIPFWTSSLIRSYAMVTLLKSKGIINSLLIYLGLRHLPLQILYTHTAVLIGLIYNLLPFVIMPLYASIERLDERLIEAARDLGANQMTLFLKIIIPLTLPGVISASILVFLPAMTLFYIPDLLGGAKSTLLGNLIQNQFLVSVNWPLGAAVSVILTIIMLGMCRYYWLHTKAKDREALL